LVAGAYYDGTLERPVNPMFRAWLRQIETESDEGAVL
jgi:hypothetical protein